MSSLYKIHQLRCRYSHEIQQQQQQQRQPTPTPSVGSLRSRLRRSSQQVEPRAEDLQTAQPAQPQPAQPQPKRRSPEAQELLQLRLARFFDSLPLVPPAPPPPPQSAVVPPRRERPPRHDGGDRGPGRLRQPAAATATIADQLNTNSSSVAMATNLSALAWRPQPPVDDPCCCVNPPSGTLSTNSLDMTEVSDITERDATGTVCAPPPTPPPSQLPQPQPPPRQPARPQPLLLLPPPPPQMMLPQILARYQQLRDNQQQQQRDQHPRGMRLRSSSVANLLDRGSSSSSNHQRRAKAFAAAAAAEATRPAADFSDHLRLLLDDFRSATTVVSAGGGGGGGGGGRDAATQPQASSSAPRPPPAPPQLPPPAPPPQLPPAPSSTSPPVAAPPLRQRGRCDHRREVRTSGTGGGGGARPSRSRPRSASTGCPAGGPGGRPVCQVFQVADVDAVRSTLIARDDRRLVKILGQFDCTAEVLDTVPMSATRLAFLVCVAAPDMARLLWCIGRIEATFPAWELKGQMRGYRGGG